MKGALKQAQQKKYAIGAFNFSTAEILKAIVEAARESLSPVIVATSEGEAKFIGMREARALVEAWRAATKMPIILNLDHGKSAPEIKKAIAAGYNAIHFDGSALSYEDNIAQTKAIVEYARSIEKTFDREIIVEGELGYLRGSSSLHAEALEIKEGDLTKPEQALEFAEKTGIDSLAIVIGNAHGIYTKSVEKLNLARLAQIKEALGEKVFLVLHGGSGVMDKDISEAVKIGVVKININTELRMAFKGALDEELKENPQEATPYKIMAPSLGAVKEVVKNKIELFGSGNKA